MFCEKCGKELKQGERFCPYCGSSCESNIGMENKEDGKVLNWAEKLLDKFMKMSKKKKIVTVVILVFLASGILGTIFDNDTNSSSPDMGVTEQADLEYISVTTTDINRYPDQYMGQYVQVEGIARIVGPSASMYTNIYDPEVWLEYEHLDGPNPLSGDHIIVYGQVIEDSLGDMAIQVQKMEIYTD